MNAEITHYFMINFCFLLSLLLKIDQVYSKKQIKISYPIQSNRIESNCVSWFCFFFCFQLLLFIYSLNTYFISIIYLSLYVCIVCYVSVYLISIKHFLCNWNPVILPFVLSYLFFFFATFFSFFCFCFCCLL